MISKTLEDKLAKLRRESEEREAQRRAKTSNQTYADLTTAPINIEAIEIVKEEEARKAKAVPVEKKSFRLAIAVYDPNLTETKSFIESLVKRGYDISVVVVSISSLKHALSFYKYAAKETEQITGKIDIEHRIEKHKKDIENINTIEKVRTSIKKQEFSPANTAEILAVILNGALGTRASDIHLEAQEKEAKIRFRIDGLLKDVIPLDNNFYSFLVSRIKLLSNLKLNIENEAQDGRFTINLPQKAVEVRVAIAPAQFGEVVVMRLLDPDAINIDLKELGLRQDDLEIIKEQLKKPERIILNTGPTGSGKTTTLYAFLKYKKTPEVKIITIEDPIEYRIDGIEQTQVNNESDYTFANGLRSMMRQDPDIILVGEIRDKETAEIAIQAALTGHLVFSTVHANSSSGAIPRLIDLKVNPTSIGSALNLIIGQRLVRRLCPVCKKPKIIDENYKKTITSFVEKLPARVDKSAYAVPSLYEPVGCENCNNTGFKGRIAIYELFMVNRDIEKLILEQVSESAFEEVAVKQGMVSMQQDGILKIIEGITTLEEVESVTGPVNWT